MQTDTVAACNIENNDFIVLDGEVTGYVYSVSDEGDGDKDWIILDVVDEDAEHSEYPFAPFDFVTIVSSL